jgi:dTDP-4-amino-4,6-dideoxygalactose transaminase
LVQLRYLEEDNNYRNLLANTYIKLLGEYSNLEIIPVAPGCYSSRHLFQLAVPERDSVIQTLHDNNIFPGVHYWDNTDYPMYSYAKGTCPRAGYYSEHLLSLPLHLNITGDDQQRIAEVLLKATRK